MKHKLTEHNNAGVKITIYAEETPFSQSPWFEDLYTEAPQEIKGETIPYNKKHYIGQSKPIDQPCGEGHHFKTFEEVMDSYKKEIRHYANAMDAQLVAVATVNGIQIAEVHGVGFDYSNVSGYRIKQQARYLLENYKQELIEEITPKIQAIKDALSTFSQ